MLAKRETGLGGQYRFDIQLRTEPDSRIVRGYAAVYNQRSVDMWGMQELIAPGAFGASLRSNEHDILGLWSHDTSKPLASRDSKTLTLSEDEHGVSFEMDMRSEISWVRDAYEAIRGGLISKMSIGFSVIDDEWGTENKKTIRTVKKGELFEISPVAFPAYAGTEAEARDLKSAHEQFLARTGAASDGGSAISIDLLLAINKHKQRGAH